MTTTRAPRAESPPEAGPRRLTRTGLLWLSGFVLSFPISVMLFASRIVWASSLVSLLSLLPSMSALYLVVVRRENFTRRGPVAHDGQGAKRVVSSERDPP